MTARNAYSRPYRRNLIAIGYERAAKYVYTTIRFGACGGRRAVFVADDGGISVYPPNHPKAQDKPARHAVGVYGCDVPLEYLEDDLLQRQRELSGSGDNLRNTK